MVNVLICLLSSLLWRVRGGLRIPFTDKKFPLNKLWFALFYSGAYWYLKGWDLNSYIIGAIATLVSYQEYGWGEYVACVLGGGKVSERTDCPLVDDIVDNMKITWKGVTYKLTDYPVLFGWVGLSLRGGLMTYMIGLGFQNIPYMFTGLLMGTVYWIGGRIGKIIPDGKNGWNWAEWLYGGALGLCLILCVNLMKEI